MADPPAVDDAALEPEPAAPPAGEPAVTTDVETAEDKAVKLGAHWRRRRFLITTTVFAALWFLMVALIQTGTPPLVYLAVLLPFYLISLGFAMRTPKALRRVKRHRASRISWTNRLTIAVAVFVALYIPFSFISSRLVPYAPVFEFFVFALGLYVLYRFVGRAVGVAPSHEALPPATHRLHRQVILAIDDPHYQRTLFLNYEFVDKGRGAKSLAKRLDDAMASVGISDDRRHRVVEDLEDYREGFRFGFGRGGKERRRTHRERRAQLLSAVYAKFSQVLEHSA